MDSIKEYFERMVKYEDKTNIYHPDQIEKSENIEFVKIAYRLLHDSVEFHKKNMANNYLTELNKK